MLENIRKKKKNINNNLTIFDDSNQIKILIILAVLRQSV